MSVTRAGQYLSDILALALVIRLSLLRLHSVYRIFCAFVALDLLSSSLFFFEKSLGVHRLDYRIAWTALRPIAWILSLWMVYALVDAMLTNLPGLLGISRKVLNIVFGCALVAAIAAAWVEYFASGLAAVRDRLDLALGVSLVFEQIIFTAAVAVLLIMLSLILWFPVQMPRNLAVFSVGFVVFFSVSAVVLLLHTYWRAAGVRLVSDILTYVLAACYGYWLIFINRAGELRPVRMGHSWQPAEQQRLIAQLEAMNATLVSSSNR